MSLTDIVKERASKILNLNKENELLQSFVRSIIEKKKCPDTASYDESRVQKQVSFEVSGTDRKGSDASPKRGPTKVLSGKAIFEQIKKEIKEKKSRMMMLVTEEIYMDRDRAAAMDMGSKDIKQSLNKKMKQERSKALQLPDQADPKMMMALGRNEMKAGNANIAMNFFMKAVEMNPSNKVALVARSKCYLVLGEPKLALDDAESALQIDKTYHVAIQQKAEALYHLGDFELSLMFYHRGLRLRPELQCFRLGVKNSQEAIESAIGSCGPLVDSKHAERSFLAPAENKGTKGGGKGRRAEWERKRSRQLLGALGEDREFLEKLLNHPDLNVGSRRCNSIAAQAEEAVRYLNKRQEFWRQHRRPAEKAKRRRSSVGNTAKM